MVVGFARFSDAISLGSILTILTIASLLFGLWRALRRHMRNWDQIQDVPNQIQQVVKRLDSIEMIAREWHEESRDRYEQHLREDHLRRR